MHGALVTRVNPGCPADKSGLRKNDIITAVNDVIVRTSEDAEALLDTCILGVTAKIQVVSGELGVKLNLNTVPQDLHVLMEEKKKLLHSPMVVITSS